MAEKKVPMRMCVGCRAMKPKRELLRVVVTKDGAVFVDEKGKANGRGAYVCMDADCLKRTEKSRALQRAELRMPAELFAASRQVWRVVSVECQFSLEK